MPQIRGRVVQKSVDWDIMISCVGMHINRNYRSHVDVDSF